MTTAPLCPDCQTLPCAEDPDSPNEALYLTECSRCFRLGGYRTHTHTCRYPDAYRQAHPEHADHTWPTSQRMRPVFNNGHHIGYRCDGHTPCDYVEYLTTPG